MISLKNKGVASSCEIKFLLSRRKKQGINWFISHFFQQRQGEFYPQVAVHGFF